MPRLERLKPNSLVDDKPRSCPRWPAGTSVPDAGVLFVTGTTRGAVNHTAPRRVPGTRSFSVSFFVYSSTPFFPRPLLFPCSPRFAFVVFPVFFHFQPSSPRPLPSHDPKIIYTPHTQPPRPPGTDLYTRTIPEVSHRRNVVYDSASTYAFAYTSTRPHTHARTRTPVCIHNFRRDSHRTIQRGLERRDTTIL